MARDVCCGLVLRRCRGEATNSLAIYLVAGQVPENITAYRRGDWSHFRLSDSPLISDHDILMYDFSNHSMRLRPEGLAKMPKPAASGTPFAVVVNGERIYLGVFATCFSSRSFAVPSIVLDRYVIFTNQPPDTLIIERGYPAPGFGVGPDPRSDNRIKAALKALHKADLQDPAPKSSLNSSAGVPSPRVFCFEVING